MKKLNDPVGCCGAAAAAVNHSGTGLANESVLEGSGRQAAGCDPAQHSTSR